MDTFGSILPFWVVFFAIAAFFLIRVARFGFKGAMFGGQIVESFGQVETDKVAFFSGRVRTHVIDKGEEKIVGMEVVFSAPLAWQMTPVRLTAAQARELAAQLADAASHAN
ncbi:MAG: hypothetical protein R3C60_00540 [Parvularculaceae bacterium]